MFDRADYWLELCDDDLKVARNLFISKDFLWMGFLCHLVAEKALKAILANTKSEIPPKVHDLSKLAELGKVFDSLSEEQKDLLEELTPLNIEARYPSYKEKITARMTSEYSNGLLTRTEAFLCWTKQRLGK